MTEAAVQDSEAMKQISYLTMVFLPATFVAVRIPHISHVDIRLTKLQGVFGMNVKEVVPNTKGTLPHYVLTVIPLTLLTIWIVMTFQTKYYTAGQTPSFWKRLMWPFLLGKQLFARQKNSSRNATSV
jgi:hypothetical protein